MGARNGNRLGAGVDTGDREPQPRHRLGDEAATAADIGEAEPGEGRQLVRVAAEMGDELAADEIDARRVHLMERAKAAVPVPPARALRSEPVDVVGVYGVAD